MKINKAPFKLIYNNDCTNILTCISPFHARGEKFIGPFHARGEKFNPRMVEATVDEIAGTGVDASLLSPDLGWVPWWPSKVYPDHYQWYEKQVGKPIQPGGFDYFVRHGGDVVKPFVDRCRHHGIAPFITYRLNDAHFTFIPRLASVKPRFYMEHPEYQLSPGGTHNWVFPKVRQYKLGLITELLENYDLAGIELDFMRHSPFFDTNKTSSDERKTIMAGFVSQVRTVLDRTVKAGKHRWLSVRVPIFLLKYDSIGIDLPAWVNKCGVEMVNLSAGFYTHQEGDLPQIREMIPEATIYHECTHCTMTAKPLHFEPGVNQLHYRRTSDEEFYSTANLAFEQGVDGISLFNFVYYREHGVSNRGTFSEPPFHVFNHLADKQWLARRKQRCYFLGSPAYADYPQSKFQLQDNKFYSRQTQKLIMRMNPPKRLDGFNLYFRIHTKQPSIELLWSVRLNGIEMIRRDFDGEPIEQPYDGLLGQANQRTGWICQSNVVRAGDNEVQITLKSGGPVDVVRVDLVLTSQ